MTYSGSFQTDCHGCFFNPSNTPEPQKLWCVCKNANDPITKNPFAELNDLLKIQDDGFMECFGHISAPA